MVPRPMYRLVTPWLFLVFLIQPVVAQVSIKATISTDQISVNEPFELVYRVENVSADHIQLPAVPGLTITRRSGTYSSFSMIQGKLSGYEEYTYPVIAQKPGKYTIPPAKITVKGKVYVSNSLEITVKAGSAKKPAEAEGDVFFKAVLSDNPIYLGQQVILHYDIYTDKNVINANFTKKPSFQHIFTKVLNTRHTGRNVVISKKQYYTQTIESFVLYAQKTGILPLEKAEIDYKYEIPNSKNPFFNEIMVKSLRTNDLKLEVLPLPQQNVPTSFSGGVGSFTFSARVDKQTITTDDVVRLTMTIRGDGDPKFWKAPTWQAIDGAEFYEPNLLAENTEIDKGREFTTREYEYLVQITKPKDLVLHPVFSYFDPSQKTYIELKDKPIMITVVPGKATASTVDKGNDSGSENFQYEAEDTGLQFIIPAILFGLISLLYFVFIQRKNRKKGNEQTENKVYPTMKETLNLHLSEAEKYEAQGNHKAFFDEILKAVNYLLKERLYAGHEVADKKTTRTILNEKNVPDTTIDTLEHLLFTCEMAVFAGQKPDMNGITEDTKSLLNTLNKHFDNNIS